MNGMPMAPGTAAAMGGAPEGVPSPQNPGGTDNKAWQMVMQQYDMVDSAIRALRNITVQALPASGTAGMKLDKLCYDLQGIKHELQQEQEQRIQDALTQTAARMMTNQQ